MKKSFLVLLLISIVVIYFGCNKDNPVSTNNNSGGTTTRTNTFGKTNSNIPVNLGLNQDTIRVDTSGTVNSVIFNLDTILNITATQLEIFLEHSGIRDTLVYQLTNPGTNFIGTIFSDAATASINTGSGNYSGTFKPYKPLSVFNGLSVNGQWKLIINSYVAQRSGVIKSWSVTINYNISTLTFSGAWQMEQLQLVSAPINGTWNALAKQALVAYGSVPASSFGYGELIFGGNIWSVQQNIGSLNYNNQPDKIFIDAQNGFLSGYSSTIKVTNDGGNSWQSRNITPALSDDFNFSFINSQTGWARGKPYLLNNTILTTTTNGGQSWNQIYDFTSNFPNYEPYQLEFINANTGFSTECDCNFNPLDRLYKTTNGGLNWSYTTFTGESYGNVNFINQNTGWITGRVNSGNAYLRKTIDGGNTWTYYTIYTGNCEMGGGVKFLNPSLGFCALNDNSNNKNIILKSIDGGQSWTIVTDKLDFKNSQTRGAAIYDEQNMLLGMGSNIIIKSTNGGTNWKVDYITVGSINLICGTSPSNTMLFSQTGELYKQTGATDPNFWSLTGYCSNSTIVSSLRGGSYLYFAGGTYSVSNNNIAFSANGFSGNQGSANFGSGTFTVTDKLKITLSLANSEKWDFTLRR